MSQGEIIRLASIGSKVFASPIMPWQHALLVEVDRAEPIRRADVCALNVPQALVGQLNFR